MLPENSQALLRAARLGIRKQPEVVHDEKETEENPKGGFNRHAGGLAMSKWTLVPREHEGPETEYLAKRRKGLPSVYSGPNGETIPMRKTKIKKVDLDGNTSVWEVLVPEGQAVDGEVVEDEPSVVAALPGTIVEGVGVVNAEGLIVASEHITSTPARRKPPIPKKKKKHGPGRGKKKMNEFNAEQTTGSTPDGQVNGDSQPLDHLDVAGGQKAATSVNGTDSPMPDAHPLDEDGSDEGSEEGDDDREDGELSPSPGQTADPSEIVRSPEKPTVMAGTQILPEPNDPKSPLSNDVQDVEHDVKMDTSEIAEHSPKPSRVDATKGIASDHADMDVDSETNDPAGRAVSDQIASPLPAMQTEDNVLPSVTGIQSPPAIPSVPDSQDSGPDISQVPVLTSSANDSLLSAGIDTSVEPQPDSVSKSPTSIPPRISKLPEPPATLPPKPPSPPPTQRMSPPPPPYPSEQLQRASVSTPKAPTPSPPTPIEATFAQGLSPKAPTMSPPTPVENDLDSSPETALADEKTQFQDPSSLALEDPNGSTHMQIPGLLTASGDQQVDVEAAPPIEEPHYNAEIPHSHNPLDGLAAPDIPPSDRSLDGEEGIDVEAAPSVQKPGFNAEIPHTHNPLDGLQAPVVPPGERQLNLSGSDSVAKFSDGDEDLLGTEEKRSD